MTKNSELVSYAKAQVGLPYWYGTFGQTSSDSLLAAKSKQYPAFYTDTDFKNQMGVKVHDCVGIVKGACWCSTNTGTPKYNVNQDKSAKGMYDASSYKGTIDSFPGYEGCLVYKSKSSSPANIHHIGVYIGNNKVVEAKSHKYGVIISDFDKSWKFWSQCPYLENDTQDRKTSEYGIDISHWQGSVKFDELDASFVLMKISQATKKDAMFDTYYSGCKAPKGGYIYCKVNSLDEAKQEAEFAVKCLKGRVLQCGVWLDMEAASMQSLGKDKLTQIINTEAKILMDAGFVVGIYCNKNWYNNVLDSKTLCKMYPFWIARYPSNDDGTVHDNLSPKNFDGCVMWQYSSKGKVKGISGNVDLDLPFTDITKLKNGELPSVEVAKPTLKMGDKGSEVKLLQKDLRTLGYTIVVDGDFGQKTKTILAMFQRDYKVGTIYDGIYGPKSYNAMKSLL